MSDAALPPVVKELRISSLWVQTFPLDAATTWHEHWWPADSLEFLRVYKDARSGRGQWSLPWSNERSKEGDEKSHFWREYLEARGEGGLAHSRYQDAWRHLLIRL
jgi:hypothetical protein